MPLTPAERNGLENLKVKIDTASNRITGEITAIQDQINTRLITTETKRGKLNELSNANAAVTTLLRIDDEGDL